MGKPQPYTGVLELLFMQMLGGMFTIVLLGSMVTIFLLKWVAGIPIVSQFAILLVLYVGYLVLAMSSDLHIKGALRAGTRGNVGWDTYMTYFPITLKMDDKLDLEHPKAPKTKSSTEAIAPPRSPPQYLFGVHPHGIHSLGAGMLVWENGPFYAKYPRLSSETRGVVASVLFFVPWVREAFLAAGYRDASRPVCERILEEGKSLYIIVGGSREALETEKGKDRVYLKRRRGFVRLALRKGVPLVPCYTFGLVDMYDTWKEPLLELRRWMVSKLQLCVPIFSGVWGTSIPYRKELTFAIGEPIPVPQIDDPSDKVVDEYLEKYIEGLVGVFDKYKEELGFGERELIVD